ncbi:MAG: MaoC family dehydratase N-terminal domain-containing protein [Pseudomonadota bacterium]
MIVTQEITDVMDPARAQALMATLGSHQTFAPGDALPAFAHHIYFWDARPPSELGRDRHPKLGEFIPDMGLPRRMWAGDQLEFIAPLRVGTPATKVSTIANADRKQGRSGPLAIVTVDHQISQDGQVCVHERQNIVYLPDRDPNTPWPDPPRATHGPAHQRKVSFEPTTLFRYSALTFNGHRIHYDLDYARSVEGYPGLVTHGPLLAQMVMLFWEKVSKRQLRTFDFRMTAPLMDFETASLCVDGSDVWVEGPNRRQCLMGTAR